VPPPLPQITLDPEQQLKLDQELAWCIGYIHLHLSTEKDAKKCLKKLLTVKFV